jgi:hypothetical protein
MEVTAVRGDTLHFSRVTIQRQPAAAEPCAHPGAGLVVLADHPDLRSERMALRGGLTWAAIIASIPLAIAAIFLNGYTANPGT